MTASPFLLAAQAAAALAAVLALVLLAGRAVRRHASDTRGLDPALRLRATLALDSRRRVHLLETPSGLVLALTGGTADQLIPLPAAIA